MVCMFAKLAATLFSSPLLRFIVFAGSAAVCADCIFVGINDQYTVCGTDPGNCCWLQRGACGSVAATALFSTCHVLCNIVLDSP